MKMGILFALLFPLAAVATPHAKPQLDDIEPEGSTYICYAYTDNKVAPKNTPNNASKSPTEFEVSTDNPVQNELTVIYQANQKVTIEPNKVFPEGLSLTNMENENPPTFASNPEAMIFFKRSSGGLPYFTIVMTDHPAKPDEKPEENPISRLITVAQCAY